MRPRPASGSRHLREGRRPRRHGRSAAQLGSSSSCGGSTLVVATPQSLTGIAPRRESPDVRRREPRRSENHGSAFLQGPGAVPEPVGFQGSARAGNFLPEHGDTRANHPVIAPAGPARGHVGSERGPRGQVEMTVTVFGIRLDEPPAVHRWAIGRAGGAPLMAFRVRSPFRKKSQGHRSRTIPRLQEQVQRGAGRAGARGNGPQALPAFTFYTAVSARGFPRAT